MSKGEETRQTIVERAAPLFNSRGFHGCSMSDIMEATGLEKGGIYRHFSSKEQIAAAAFHYAVEATISLRTSRVGDSASPMATLRAWIARFAQAISAVAGGCPLLNTAVDADDGNEVLRRLVREAFKAWRERIIGLLNSAVDAGELAADVDIVWLADSIIMMLEGAVMLSRIERRKEPLLHARRALDIILDSVARPAGSHDGGPIHPL